MRPLLFAALFLAFPLGCDPEAVGPAKTPVPGTQSGSGAVAGANDQVIARIADAACDREQSCNNIGPGVQFKDRAECTETMRSQLAPKLSHDVCPGGIEQRALDSCIDGYRANECQQPGQDTLTRSVHCSTSDLCLK